MAKLSIAKVHQLARGAGLTHEQAVMATAIAMGESGLNPGAVGDTSLTDATWGPSIGLWQIRSLKSQTGTGKERDATQLKRPAFNAASMRAISSGGTNWTPWTIYNNGTYKSHLSAVRAAVGAGSGSGMYGDAPIGPGGLSTNYPLVPTGGVKGVDWGLDIDPMPGGSGLPGWGDDLLGGLPGIPSGSDVEQTLLTGLLWSAAFGLGVTLVAIGAWRAVQ